MDRLNRTLAGGALVLVLAAGGCKSMRPEVPPGRGYANDGRQMPSVGFSNEAHPMGANAMGGIGANGMPTPGDGPNSIGQQSPYGTPNPSSSPFGAPQTGGSFGPPGTAGAAPEMGGPGAAGAAGAAPSAAYPPAAAPAGGQPGLMGQPGGAIGQPGAAPGSM